ncbi:hypothetical protein NDU88_011130 [Pleurodeles waltl]|uniref:Uncharacterized protein n=1 Tax=Pleurodeles waltl TaxID=8319 RepID=A0AAV7R0J4_PLEWA|nr:hypothetical protein NDU88_011130 [Pleurodeles waltl]
MIHPNPILRKRGRGELPLAYSRRKEAGRNLGSAQCACARMGNERGLRPLNERALVFTACSRSTPVG